MRYDINYCFVNGNLEVKITDTLFYINYKKTLDASKYDILKIYECDNKYYVIGSLLILENQYYTIKLSLECKGNRATATYLVYKKHGNEYICDIINGEQYDELFKFASTLYYKNLDDKEKLKKKINFIHKIKDVDIYDTYFMVFLNLFLSYFSYNNNANIHSINIDMRETDIAKEMYLIIDYNTYESPDMYCHYVMHHVFPGDIISMLPQMPIEKKKQRMCITHIYTQYGRIKTFYGIKKSRCIIDNYFSNTNKIA